MQSCHRGVGWFIVDTILWISAILGVLAIYFLSPLKQPFRCDDPLLGRPYIKEHRISNTSLIGISYFLPCLAILICEFINTIKASRYQYISRNSSSSDCFCCCQTKGFIYRVLCRIVHFVLGMAFVMLFVAVGKTISGSPRPHFIAVCKPNITLANCSGRYLSVDSCTGEKEDIDEARRSFPSGHAAIGGYAMLFFSIYVEYVLSISKVRLLKPILQMSSLGLALACGLTRVNDFYHFQSDVWAGFVMGFCVAIFMTFHVMDIKKEKGIKRIYKSTNENHQEEQTLKLNDKNKNDRHLFSRQENGIHIPNGKGDKDLSCKVVIKSAILESL